MILFLLAFVAFLIIGIPISVSIGFSAVLGCLSLGYPLVVIGQKMVSGIDSWLLIAIPLFILAGNLMNAGKITDELFGTARELVGWIPGGLGHANVLASVIFAGMSGSASADAGGLGAIEIKAMRDHGYDDDFSAAVTAASSVIGPIFPPSIPLIIYGASASVSVSKLFMGRCDPGAGHGSADDGAHLHLRCQARLRAHRFQPAQSGMAVCSCAARLHHPRDHSGRLYAGLVHPHRGLCSGNHLCADHLCAGL